MAAVEQYVEEEEVEVEVEEVSQPYNMCTAIILRPFCL